MDLETNNYPDIILISDIKRGISTKTMQSFVKYAENSSFICKPNNGINIEKGDRIQNHRLQALQNSNSEYVLIMDDDDELISILPKYSSFNDVDVIFFNFNVNKRKRNFFTCPIFSIYGSCGIIAKRKLAEKAILNNIKEKYFREDIGYFYYLFIHCKQFKIENYALINKIEQREPQRSHIIHKQNQKEVVNYWVPKINKLRSENVNIINRSKYSTKSS